MVQDENDDDVIHIYTVVGEWRRTDEWLVGGQIHYGFEYSASTDNWFTGATAAAITESA